MEGRRTAGGRRGSMNCIQRKHGIFIETQRGFESNWGGGENGYENGRFNVQARLQL